MNCNGREIVATTRHSGHFEPHLQCAGAESVQILFRILDLVTPFDSACFKIHRVKKS